MRSPVEKRRDASQKGVVDYACAQDKIQPWITGRMKARSSIRSSARPSSGLLVLQELKQGKFRPVYVILGEDTVTTETILSQLKQKLVEPGLEAFDFESLDADIMPLQDLHQKLRQLPVGKRRLVFIRSITGKGREGPVFGRQLNKSEAENICRIIAQVQVHKPPSPNPLVVVAMTGVWSRDLETILANSGLAGFIVDVSSPTGLILQELIHSWARERNITLTPRAVELLLEISGEDTATLRSEVDKLATCVQPGTEIDTDTIQKLAASSREFELKDYVTAVLARDSAQALRILRHLEDKGEQLPRIVGWLTTAFLDLVAAQTETISAYARRRLAGAERNWRDLAELNRFLRQLYLIHKSQFEGKPEPFARLELWTWCVGCTTRRERCHLAQDEHRWSFCIRHKSPKTKRETNEYESRTSCS